MNKPSGMSMGHSSLTVGHWRPSQGPRQVGIRGIKGLSRMIQLPTSFGGEKGLLVNRERAVDYLNSLEKGQVAGVDAALDYFKAEKAFPMSKMHMILGPENGWHPIPLTELITTAAVKKGYKKATLCVHSDKL